MIKIRNLHKSYGKLNVLKGIDLDIEDGQTLAIIGPSGGGKSTLLRCLNLLEIPQKGTIDIGHHHFDVQKTKKKEYLDFRRASAMVFQNYALSKSSQKTTSFRW